MYLYIPFPYDLSVEDELRLQAEVMKSWALYGELHLTNAPRGQGLTLLDPKYVTYNPPEEDPNA